MPVFERSQVVPRPVEEVFAFFRDPTNLVKVSPPELRMKMVEGPPQLELGSRLVFQAWRWGLPQRVASEVTAFDPTSGWTDAQVQGPFGKFVHTHRFEAVTGGTRVTDHIEYEPPRGLLGLVVTAAWIEGDLQWVFEHRAKKLAELFGG
jgi:ligand-binding SRPBCC domain-containing protein